MKIIITGSAGFIGYHLSKKFLQNKKNNIIGIDTINDYYSPKIKNFKLKIFKKYKNFKFLKLNLIKRKKVDQIFKNFRPNVVFILLGNQVFFIHLKTQRVIKQTI